MEFIDWYRSEPSKYWQPDKSKHIEQDIVSNPEKYVDYLASEKMDGNWCRVLINNTNNVLIQSRTISKKTGEYGDLTEKVPHIVEYMKTLPKETVILGELCYMELEKHSDEVGSILRCLPPKAVARQKTSPLHLYIFDVLMWDGHDIHLEPYINRIEYFSKIEQNEFIHCAKPRSITEIAAYYDEYLDKGGEGFVLNKKIAPYNPGTRTAWSSIKLKQATEDLELKVIDTIEPNEEYQGDDASVWEYRNEFDQPVTKRFYYGWKNGVLVDYNGNKVKVTSGCSDADAEWLASEEAQNKIKNGELIAVVRAMQVTKDGSLRHPVLVRLRDDV